MIKSKELDELLQRWKEGVDKPFKGRLIDYGSYCSKNSLSCMCAQGQILHIVGGYQPEYLIALAQRKADYAVAKLLNIPLAHARLLYIINDKEEGAPYDVLYHPEKYLGPNPEVIMAGWDSFGIEYNIEIPSYAEICVDLEDKVYSNMQRVLEQTSFTADEIMYLSTTKLTEKQKADALQRISERINHGD